MLQQLTRLSIDTDGRYATDSELKFLEDYLESAETRISAYEKIRDSEEKWIHHLKMRIRALNPQQVLFQRGKYDMTGIWERDMRMLMYCTTAAMLINDLDRLREGTLIWHQTITKAQKVQQITRETFGILVEIIGQYLTPEEAKCIIPGLQLDQAVLGG